MPIWKTNAAEPAEPADFEFAPRRPDPAVEAMLEQAREEAARIIDAATAEAEAIRQTAFDTAIEDADRKLRIEEETRQQFAAPLLARLAHEIEKLQSAALAEAERSVLPLAAALARKAIARELNEQPAPSIELLREAVTLLLDAASLQIFVPAAAVAPVSEAVARLQSEMTRCPVIEVAADCSLAAGDLVLRSAHGVIDQRSSTRLESILAELETA